MTALPDYIEETNRKNSILAEDAFQTFNALKMHFDLSNNYDYFKYRGKTYLKLKEKDKFWFAKFATKYEKQDQVNYILYNIIEETSYPYTIKEWMSSKYESNYNEGVRRNSSLLKTLSDDLELINYTNDLNEFKLLFKSRTNSLYPEIIDLILEKKISKETYIILNRILRFSRHLDKIVDDVLIWPDLKYQLTLYNRFVSTEWDEQCKEYFKNKFSL